MQRFEVFQNVNTVNTDISTYTLDDDLLSLEISRCYSYLFLLIIIHREMYLEKNISSVELVAKAISTIQELYGVIPKITAVGPNSQSVAAMIVQNRLEGNIKEVNLPSEIDRLILLDRSVDLITPFVTPLTYEGLIDEVGGGRGDSCVDRWF